MTATPEQITLLHLSDPQFGRNHRFGGDEPADTLLQRLKTDLDGLRKTEGLAPDLLVLTGDLAEWALPDEFDEVRAFIEGLSAHIGLSRGRIACVPGNHDINRDLCAAHFLSQKGCGAQPVPPFWPKWQHYRDRLFDPLYASEPSATFTEAAPWTLFEVPDLRLVVAGLNSTLKESHLDADHYGWVGENQLKWFADRLKRYRTQGWLRIGAVHHNVRRGETDDNENLRDAGDLKRYLVDPDLLNLVLHGHTHLGQLDWWTRSVPILATGSAALTTDPRPPEVPNQYQIIRIEAGRLRQWCRAYAPERKQFIADTRAAKDGNDWHRDEPFDWVDVMWSGASSGLTAMSQDSPNGSGAPSVATGTILPRQLARGGTIHAAAFAGIAEALERVPALLAALGQQPAFVGTSRADEVAERICSRDQAACREALAAFRAALPEAARQQRRNQGEASILRLAAHDILGWMTVTTVLDDYAAPDAPLVQAWFDGAAFRIPLGRSACLEVLSARWGPRKAEFGPDRSRWDHGPYGLSLAEGAEVGIDEPLRWNQDRALDYVRRLIYQHVFGRQAPPTLHQDEWEELRGQLAIRRQEKGQRRRLVIDGRGANSAFDYAATLQAIHQDIPEIDLIVIVGPARDSGGIFLLPAVELSANIKECLEEIEALA